MSAVVSLCLPLSLCPSNVCDNGERGGARSAISLSVSLFVLWRHYMLPQGEEEEGRTVAVKSRLWLMNRGAMPSHWAEFTSSHNHLSFFIICLHPPSTSFSLLSLTSCSFFPVLFVYISESFSPSLLYSLHPLFAMIKYASLIILLSLLFPLSRPFFLHTLNLSTFAASGTRTRTQSPGTSLTRPTSTSLWPSTQTTRT